MSRDGASAFGRFLRRLRFEIRERVGLFPMLLPIWKLFARTRRFVVRPTTGLVIEGFPRSANTFACLAFELAQGGTPLLAHHLHVPSQVLYAVRRGIPALVLIREPSEAVLAAKLVMPEISAGQLLRAYVRFYGRILPFREGFVVGTFEEVTTRFDRIIGSVNEKFGLKFTLFVHSAENQEHCFRKIEDLQRRLSGDTDFDFAVARPSPPKARLKEEIRGELEDPRLEPLLARARVLYDAIRGVPPTAPGGEGEGVPGAR